ncbi:hypothetical protein B2D07_10390 [Desulfococcus multivorans]|nr:hypothetical protein B2D07_10390 [Desulfococcus multivorans]
MRRPEGRIMTERILKFGIDVHGVADADVAFFSGLTRLLVENGHEVHLLTGVERTPELEHYLKTVLGLSWTHLFSIISHARESGATIETIRGNPYVDEDLWERAKAEHCRRNGIDLHLDDSAVYGRHFRTPYAKYYKNRRPRKKRKIAIIGGSFNPVTNAHIMMAEAILKVLPDVHQVWMMPAYHHPFEKHRGYSSHRIRMIRLVETPGIRYFGYEIDHRLSGVTYETFSRLLDDPDYRDYYVFHMVIGADCVFDFDTKWQHADALAARVPFIILPRAGYDLERYHGLLSRPPHVILTDVAIPDISATEVRARAAAGVSIRGLVPAAVESYIRHHRLYRRKGEGETVSALPDRHFQPRRQSSTTTPAALCDRSSVFIHIAVCTLKDDQLSVLMIRGKDEPPAGEWMLPGGPLELPFREDLSEIAVRKLAAETGLADIYIEQLKTYGGVVESRQECRVNVAYFALVPYERIAGRERSGNSAESAWMPLRDYRTIPGDRNRVPAKDQERILLDLTERIRGKISYTPIAFELVSDRFTWPDLRKVYEIVLGRRLDAANFKRKIRSMYRIRELTAEGGAYSVGRPPKQLKFDGIKEGYV